MSLLHGEGNCYLWALLVYAAVKGMVSKQFSLGLDIEIIKFGSRIGYRLRVPGSQQHIPNQKFPLGFVTTASSIPDA